MKSSPDVAGSILDMSIDSKKTLQDNGTSKHLISQVTVSSTSEDFEEIADGRAHLRLVWGVLSGWQI